MITTDPRFMDENAWTSFMVQELQQFGQLATLRDPSEWQAWAAEAVALPAIAALGPPNPYLFPTWQAWAVAFNQIAQLLPN